MKHLNPSFVCCIIISSLAVLTGCSATSDSAPEPTSPPNLIYIIADDMGYGDIKAMNPECKIATPHLDRLASEGIIFTDAHTTSSVCTPTRYNVLTGRYNWRTHLKKGVLNGYGKPLIPEDRLTLASLCRDQGYRTAMIGKWHLGMDLPIVDEGEGLPSSKKARGRNLYVDWSQPVKRSPTSNGFDYFWGHVASLDFPPYNYIENQTFQSQEVKFTSRKEFEEMTGSDSFMRAGWLGHNFDPVQTLEEFFNRSSDYIRKQNNEKPFFLYVPLTAPHTPIFPIKEFQGKSGLNAYGDFVMQVDDGVGRIMKAVEDAGIANNTIILFTTDNGCSPQANFEELAEKGHSPNGIYRGHKADIWEGGHRVPHILRWPAVIKAGSESDRLTLLGDIVATMADILDVDLADNTAEDSLSFLPSLQGRRDPAKEHEGIVNHSVSGQFAIRTKEWKLIFCPGSGGWSKPKDAEARKQGLPEYQLYDMVNDPVESKNLVDKHPDKAKELTDLITRFIVDGRSTPGAPQKNDTPNDWEQLVWMKEKQ
jgi:arylsulfatase A